MTQTKHCQRLLGYGMARKGSTNSHVDKSSRRNQGKCF